MSVAVCKVTDDAIYLGADSNVSFGPCSQDSVLGVKIFEEEGMLGAGTGDVEAVQLFRFFLKGQEWEYTESDQIDEHMVLSLYHHFDKNVDEMGFNLRDETGETQSHFFWVLHGKAFVIRGYFVQEVTDFEAIGCGEQVAKAIMKFGGSAEQAMDLSCTYNSHCDYPLSVYRYDKVSKSIDLTIYERGDTLP